MVRRNSLLMFALSLLFIFLIGCNREVIQRNYTYEGENEKWEAELRVKGTSIFTKANNRMEYDSKDERTFTLKFKGNIDELKTIKNLTYSYDSSASSTKESINFASPPTKQVFTSKSSSKGGAIEVKNEVIKVIIIVDGVESSFNMKSK